MVEQCAISSFSKKGIKNIIKKTTLVAHFPAGAPLLVTTSNGALCLDAPLVCLDRRTSSKKNLMLMTHPGRGAPLVVLTLMAYQKVVRHGAPLVWCAISVNPIYSPFSSSDVPSETPVVLLYNHPVTL